MSAKVSDFARAMIDGEAPAEARRERTVSAAKRAKRKLNAEREKKLKKVAKKRGKRK